MKTLKDINPEHVIREYFVDIYINTLTLEQFSNMKWCVEHTKSELRQSAIEWLKMLKKKRKECKVSFEIGWNEGRQNFIEEFFNITDEDLK